MRITFAVEEGRDTARVDLSRLPATIDTVLPSNVGRRSLIVAGLGMCALAITAGSVGYVEYAATGLGGLEKFGLVGIAVAMAVVGAKAFQFASYETNGWTRRRLVTISIGHVDITRWSLFGLRKFSRVPLSDYTGVTKMFEDYGKFGIRYNIALIHADARLSIYLYSSHSAADWDKEWRGYADVLGLPAIDEGCRRREVVAEEASAITVRPGVVFTLDLEEFPATVQHVAVSWSRPVGLLVGIGFGGMVGFFLWQNWQTTRSIFEGWDQLAFMVLLLAMGIWGFAIAIRSHLEYRRFRFDGKYVEGKRRRLFGMERWVEPISGFRGVARSAGKEATLEDSRGETVMRYSEKVMRYTVNLVHRQPEKSVTLYRASHDADIPAKLRYYAERLGVPIVDEAVSVTPATLPRPHPS